jgi:hypothetical protein
MPRIRVGLDDEEDATDLEVSSTTGNITILRADK